MDKMKRLSDTIKALMEEEFSGYIRINFTQGSLGRVEKSEEIENDEIAFFTDSNGKKPRGEKKYQHDNTPDLA